MTFWKKPPVKKFVIRGIDYRVEPDSIREDLERLGFEAVYVMNMISSRTRKPLPMFESTAVGQAVACVPVTQRAQVQSPVGTSFLGEVFSGFFLTCKTNVRKL